MSDEYNKFVRKAVAGDKQAFGKLYELFLDRIYRFVYYLVRDEFLAEDLTQNAFLKAWNGLSNFSLKRGTFQSYIYTIARNLVIDNQRKKKNYSIEGMNTILETSDDNVAEIWKKQRSQKVHEALGDLKDEDREILILRYFEDMHFDEIGKITGKNPGSLRVKAHRLMEILKNKLEGKV